MYQLQQSPGRTTIVDDKEFLFFSGYSYLGMGHLPAFTELVQQGMSRYGLLHPSSRVSNTILDLYNQLEERLSTLTGTEETVTFSSGFLAGRAIVELLAKDKRNCFVAPGTHAAIQNGVTPLNKHWKKEMLQAINESDERYFVLLADAVLPLKACVQDFSFLQDLDPGKHLTCIIDDSHGIGILGPNGEGISHSLPRLPNVEYILSYSLSKALHINGGAVSCNTATARLLRQSAYYTASTPISPALVYAYLNSHELYRSQLATLRLNIASFVELLDDVPGIIHHPALPIFLLRNEFDQTYFDPHRVLISSFSYPDPEGIPINRIVLNALHVEWDLKKLAFLLQNLR